MTVEVTTDFSGPYITNGATTVFPFTFISMDGDEIGVLLRDADGVDTIADTADYSVTRAADGTGSVVYASAPATGYDLYIFSDVSFAQSVEFEDGSGWKAAPVNSVADRSAARDIWLKGRVDRALLAPLGEVLAALPSSDARLGKFLAFDAEGNPVAADGTGPDGGLRSDLAASGGSALTGFIQSGAGATSRAVQSKLRDFASVKDYEAAGDGTTDDTNAFTNAMAAANKVFVPSGTYVVDVATIPANTELYGEGASSIIKQKSSFVGGSTGSLYANSGSSSTTIDNIVIRDLRIEGTNIATPTFSEFKHLTSLNGVRNVLIENVQLIGWQGDAIYIGSGVVGGDERHNYNVTVRNCLFDGINRENRQGISVIDGIEGLISGCTFQNCSKSTMPGPIDFEPDNAAFHLVKYWTIENCTFDSCGGNLGQIGVLFPPLVPLPEGMKFLNNTFKSYVGSGADIAVDIRRTATSSDVTMGMLIAGNTGKSGVKPFGINAVNGLVITETNTFQDYTDSSFIGFSGSTDLARDVVHKATYIRVGSADTRGLRIGKVEGGTFGGSMIECATNTSSSYPVQLLSVTMTKVTFEGLRITKRSSQTIAINDAGATLTASGNKFVNNFLDGLTNQFQSQTYSTGSASLLASWTGTADIEASGNVAVLQFSISGGTQTASTLIATVPAGFRPRAQTRAVFGSGTGVVELRFDTDGAVFITPNNAPASTIRGSISYTLPV